MQKIIAYIKESLNAYYPESEILGFTRIIIEYIFKTSYPQVLIEQKQFSDEDMIVFESTIERLKKYEPIQYVIGETEFFGLPFFVDQNVLIPRPETEELVELILQENPQSGLKILDIGTGSGAIAITLAKHLKNANMSAWDISDKALAVAQQNANTNQVVISFSEVNVLNACSSDKKFDIIVSNPPYILELEKEAMDKNVLDYEPHIALFVPDNKPLLFYDRIADIALENLNPNGKLYFEINRAKGKEIVQLLENKGFIEINIFQDLSRNDRMVRAHKR